MTEYHFLALSSTTISFCSWDSWAVTCWMKYGSGWLCLFPLSPTLRVFGHFSLRSEWQLVKVDYKSLFSRRCTKEDQQTWHLHNQVSPSPGGHSWGFLFPCSVLPVGMQSFFAAKYMDFFSIPWRMCMNKHGARHLWASSGDYLLFFENNPLHQLGLFGLNA